jgi:hypothetical protein
MHVDFIKTVRVDLFVQNFIQYLQDPKDRERTSEGKDGYDKDSQSEIDARSIYVGNVEYTVDSAELADFFGVCFRRPGPSHIPTFWLLFLDTKKQSGGFHTKCTKLAQCSLCIERALACWKMLMSDSQDKAAFD